MRNQDLRMSELLSRGTNGGVGYTRGGRRAQVLGRDQVAFITNSLWKELRRPIGAYLLSLWCLATSLAVLSVHLKYSFGDVWVVGVLALAAAVSERQRVAIGRDSEASISLIPIVFAAVLFGPLAAMVVAAASWLGAVEPPYMKWAVYTSISSITGAMSGFVAAAAASSATAELPASILGTAAGATVAEASSVGFYALTMHLRGKGGLQAARVLIPLASASVLLYGPVIAVLVIAYQQVSPLTLPLFLAPALAAQRLFGMYQKQRKLAEDLAAANIRLERANLSFATALVATLDARDQYTAGHSAAVAIYARDIAARLGLSEEQQQLAHLCGLVHDIGKIGLPPGLLEKPGALTLAERRQMEKHSEIGERILAKVDDYAEVAKIVRHHHERWDGQGYPDGLAGEEIPLISRIIAVADAYNAMTSNRPYRDAMPSRVARMRLAQGVESQFDTTVVAAFEAVLAGATEEYREARRSDFNLGDQDVYSDQSEPVAARESSAVEVA
jgi:putative nucleotidyltransferase with HDIG domain